MKPGIFLALFIALSVMTLAQDRTGSFFIESGVKLAGGGDYLNFIGKTGISLNKNKTTYYYPDNYTSEYLRDAFSYSLAPRVGYQLDKLFSIGIDYQYFNWKVKNNMTYWNSTAGVFLRKNITTTKVRPYIELSYGLGKSKEVTYGITHSGAEYTQTEKMNLHYFAGAAGTTVPLNENLTLSFWAKIQNTIEKESKQQNSAAHDLKDSNIEVAPMMSVSYYIKKKNKQ